MYLTQDPSAYRISLSTGEGYIAGGAVGVDLRSRQQGLDPQVVARAWATQLRNMAPQLVAMLNEQLGTIANMRRFHLSGSRSCVSSPSSSALALSLATFLRA